MSVDPYKGFVFNPADLAEDVDLDLDRRREILFAPSERRLTNYLHIFEVLLETVALSHAVLAGVEQALDQALAMVA